MPQKLTEKQTKILNAIGAHLDDRGYPPTIRELQSACGISSTSVVDYNLDKLEDLGLITREPEVSRGIRLTFKAGHRPRRTSIDVPVAGTITGADNIEIDPDLPAAESIQVAARMVPPTCAAPVALRIGDDSFAKSLLSAGDYALVDPAQDIRLDESTQIFWASHTRRLHIGKLRGTQAGARVGPGLNSDELVPLHAIESKGRVFAIVRIVQDPAKESRP